MRVSQQLMLIGGLAGLGCLYVGQRNALLLKGYAVGERVRQVHARETDVSWLQAQLTGLTSPARLAQAAEERQLNLVARLQLPSSPVEWDHGSVNQ